MDILINELDDFQQAIEYVITSQVHNIQLWDALFMEAQKNSKYLAMLLKYVEYYSRPEMIFRSIPDGTELKEVRESLIEAFQQIKLQYGILKNFELLSKTLF